MYKIRIHNHYADDWAEARGEVDERLPVLAVLFNTVSREVENVLACTCASVAQKAWYVQETEDMRKIK